jgi:hypothetical protein
MEQIRNILSIRFVNIVLLLSIIAVPDVISQEEKRKFESFDTKREEIQRYFGYELLLYRYLSTPYDINVNTTQSGNFVDIGFLFIVFIPILLLFLVQRRKWLYWLFLLYLIFLWIISTSNSFVFSHQKAKINTTQAELNDYLNTVAFSTEPLDIVVGKIHLFSQLVYTPFKKIGHTVSGDSDYITYPFLFLIFIIVSYFLVRTTRQLDQSLRYFIALTWMYAFYWLTFGGGIIWYGYILIPLLYLFITVLFGALKIKEPRVYKVLYPVFIALGIFWICIASVDRVSNIQPNIPAETLGKGIFNPTFYDYACGKITREQAINKLYPNIGNSLEKINSDRESYVWRVGTSMTYFIENNNNRVVMDNQLGLFHPLNYTYPDKEELVEVMKASGFKYLIMDLLTATIDNTPNKTLTTKFKALESFVKDNPKVRLLGTDRIVVSNNNGQNEFNYGLYGQIYYPGRYAIFEFI